MGGARSVGSVLVVGEPATGVEEARDDGDVVWARATLDGPGTLLTAVGSARAVAQVLAGEGGAQPPWW